MVSKKIVRAQCSDGQITSISRPQMSFSLNLKTVSCFFLMLLNMSLHYLMI